MDKNSSGLLDKLKNYQKYQCHNANLDLAILIGGNISSHNQNKLKIFLSKLVMGFQTVGQLGVQLSITQYTEKAR